MIELTIGIPTANRPEKIKTCLDSIIKYLSIPYKVIIVDSSESEMRLDNNFVDRMQIIHPDAMVSPSHARKIISDNVNTEFLLYLDDDMTITEGSVEKLLKFLKSNNDVDIVGGSVIEYGYWRDIGLSFIFGECYGEKIIEKKAITKEILESRGFSSFKVDFITQPPFLMRSKIFEKVTFDPNYKWAKEIYDFFYACYVENIISYVIPDSIFEHFPAKYSAKSFKHHKMIYNRDGGELFYNKWGIRIQNPVRQNIVLELFREVKYRRNKRKMSKNKINRDQI